LFCELFPERLTIIQKSGNGWNTVFYSYRMNDYTVERFNNNGPEYVNSVHVNAYWIQAGTWIEIHISISSDLPDDEARAKLENVLETIKVFELQP
jgi:CDP-diacylglycerol pyrophosphatase